MSLQFRSIVTFTWLEVLRTRMVIFVALTLAAALAVAEFGSGLAVTETAEYRSAIYAGLTRLATVFIVALFVTTSILREIDDKVLDLVLSRPVNRTTWFAGKFASYALAAAGLASCATLPLVFYGRPDAAICWGVSLACELLIIIAACLTCLITLSQITVALSVVAAFYLLSRSISAIALMSKTAVPGFEGPSSELIATGVEALAYLLPDLGRFTNAAWLVAGDAPWDELNAVVAQTVVYVALLFGVGLFDLHRRNF